MHPYSKDTHPPVTLNINLVPCTCADYSDGFTRESDGHWVFCKGRPVLIPCPIPRSVPLEVRLGRCDYPSGACEYGHLEGCAAYPIRVSCSISGTTWAASEVTACDVSDAFTGSHELDAAQHPVALAACRERWALVKALVLGQRASDYGAKDGETWCGSSLRAFAALFAQRDTVYAALADMARAEQAAHAAEDRISRDIRDTARGIHYWHATVPDHRPSAVLLARYVERLIETIGVLP